MLARVLAQLGPPRGGPAWLLLDEPTAALDPRHRHRVLDAVRRRAGSGRVGAFIVLHDLNLAATYADRVLLQSDGRLVADGTPAAVLTTERLSTVYDAPIQAVEDPLGRSHPLIIDGSPDGLRTGAVG